MHLAFKVLYKDRTPCSGGSGKYPETGEWHEFIPNPEKCRRGYHVVPLNKIGYWYSDGMANSKDIWLVEVSVPFDEDSDKIACGNIRLIKKLKISRNALRKIATRLFSVDTMYSALQSLTAYPTGGGRGLEVADIISKDLSLPLKLGRMTASEISTTTFGKRNGRVPRAKKAR